MKLPDTITADSDIPCFVCTGGTSVIMAVKMGELEKDGKGELSIAVVVGVVTLICRACDWEYIIKETDKEGENDVQ